MTGEPVIPLSFIGCDAGKASIAVFDSRDGRTRTVANQRQALAAFAASLDAFCLVVCEATGGHEAALLCALLHAAIPAHRADARKVKAFIRSFGILGKTDSIDAHALAQYGKECHAQLPRWQAPDAAAAAAYLQALQACLSAQIAAIEAGIEALIAAHEPLQAASAILCGVTGIGRTTAAAILGLMPELGSVSRAQCASLAGVAPHPRQSGATDAYRRTQGGRPEVKRVLFMAAISAARYHPTLKPFYERLAAKGKKPIVAITAVMRKLIVLCNALLREHAQRARG